MTAYVIDAGVLTSHPDFEGRASEVSIVKGKKFNATCNSHGTHVAGVVGSKTYGVAKEVSIVSVRVTPCQGGATVTDLVKGLNWVAKNAQKPAVVTFTFSTSSGLDAAVQNVIDNGITVVVAAGNTGQDACLFSPARVPDAITVSGTDDRDIRPDHFNYGPCVDVYAPGVNILSTWNNGSWGAMSGISTAVPHVAGIAALYLEQHPNASPSEVQDAIVNNATPISEGRLAYSIF